MKLIKDLVLTTPWLQNPERIAVIEELCLKVYKEGMTNASDVLAKRTSEGLNGAFAPNETNKCRKDILIARDNTTVLPE